MLEGSAIIALPNLVSRLNHIRHRFHVPGSPYGLIPVWFRFGRIRLRAGFYLVTITPAINKSRIS